jgi:hypothetical protein
MDRMGRLYQTRASVTDRLQMEAANLMQGCEASLPRQVETGNALAVAVQGLRFDSDPGGKVKT